MFNQGEKVKDSRSYLDLFQRRVNAKELCILFYAFIRRKTLRSAGASLMIGIKIL